MKKLLMLIPSWETFLLYIGGIPTLISTAILAFMIFVGARNKAFSFKSYKTLVIGNRIMLKREDALRKKIISAPWGVRRIHRLLVGDTAYSDLMSGR